MFKREMTVNAAVENLESVIAFVDGCLEELSCPLRAQMQIDIAVDEVFSNIAYYAYPTDAVTGAAAGTDAGIDAGTVTVQVEAAEEPPAVILTFIDGGTPYDPLSHEDPDMTLPAEDRPIGGLGIYMVRKIMDRVSYSWESGKNILKIEKRI
ncbi:MAG: ATP-binding protein [Anaerovoracaceae bacterium]